MSNRIKELAEQATKFIPDDVKDDKGLSLFIEMYAQLIVKECANVLVEKYANSDFYSIKISENSREQILKHFGVGE